MMPNTIKAIILFLICALCACQNAADKDKLFRSLSQKETGINFQNAVHNSEQFNIFSYRNFYNGGGVAIGDINDDGLADIYFTHNTGPNALYLNTGDFRFENITEKSGVSGRNMWSTGVVMVDINADGLLDIYVCNAGYLPGDDQENELFINNGDLTFTEHAADYGLNEDGYTTHAAFFDYDGDGDLDCYVLNNSFIPVNTLNYSGERELRAEDWPVRDFLKGGGDKLLRNDDGRYSDVTALAGIYSSLIGFGLGVTVGDVNGDHLPDMYISNDFFERDYLYINNGDGTFSEQIKHWIQHLSLSSMGADIADINNDGYPEIFVTDMLPDNEYRLKTTASFETYNVFELKQERDFYNQYMQNTLQLNNKNGTFSEIAYFSGVAASDWSWSALMFDMDNDGYRDIYICTGIYQDVTDQDFIDFFANDVIQRMVMTGRKEEFDSVLTRMPSKPILNKVFHNQGNLHFDDRGMEWGFDTPSFSNGAAYGDLDNDGDLDLVVNNMNEVAFVYENFSERFGNHYMSLTLTGPPLNGFAIGAKVAAHAGNAVHYAEVMPSRGFQSSVDYPVHFGLGDTPNVDSVVIIWPDRTVTTLIQPAIDTMLLVRYAEAAKRDPQAPKSGSSSPAYLSRVNQEFQVPVEDHFVDFYHEGLILKKLSQEGPAMSIGDIDEDGDTDIFVGGPANQSAHIYLQTNGVFVSQEQTGLEREQEFEDVCSALFDVDSDGDLDLFVGSGGNTTLRGARSLQDRLYLNDGTGHYVLSPTAFPNNGYNTGAVLPFDFDDDGDTDLIVGSRSVPLDYGISPPSYIYENDGNGKFADVTDSIAPAIRRLGMITDIVSTDLDKDGTYEIIFTGEWMSPTVFRYQNGKFNKIDCGLQLYPGWWNAIEVADMDNDGDIDLVLGNRGENFYFTASPDAPAKLWLADLDENGTIENIVTRTVDGRDMPLAMRSELTEQLVSMKKKNLRNSEYATMSMQELFPAEILQKAQIKTATYFSSAIAINDGHGHFTMQPLPPEVQLSCVRGILCHDINGDSVEDLILGGNDYGFPPQFSRLDASFGQVLINDGKGNLKVESSEASGFFVNGQIRYLNDLKVDDDLYLIVGINGQEPELYKFKNQ